MIIHLIKENMKNFVVTLLLFVSVCTGMVAGTIHLTGDITVNKTWGRNNIYIIDPGFHYVKNNATLTIQSGTLIKGNGGSLVITRGAKLIANGTETAPIIFTSSKAAGSRAAGDWGGVLLCGKAPINDPAGERAIEGGVDPVLGLYGGTDPNDNSGSLKYVRIEYAGIAYQPNNETNGLTCGGVGAGTVLDHIQVSRGGDDSFEWFGGRVNAKYLVAYAGLDDDFDTDYGFEGNVQFALGLRDPNTADISGSNGFESDNDATGTTNAPFTDANFSNVTSFGPIHAIGDAYNANYKRGAHERRSTKQDVRNSVIVGWPTGIKIESTNSGSYAVAGELNFKNDILAGNTTLLDGAGAGFDINAWYASSSNTTLANPTDVNYKNPYASGINPDFRANAGSPVLSGANFSGLPAFFVSTTYVGAFNTSTDWTDCWCSFDPQNEAYTTANTNYLTAAITPAGTQIAPVVLTATAGTGFTYKWYKNNVALTGATSTHQTYNATAAGAYKCRITTPRGCVAFSNVVTVLAALNADVTDNNETLNFIDQVKVYPNPSNGVVNVDLNMLTDNAEVVLSVYDMMGKLVANQTIIGVDGLNQFQFDGTNLPKGIYMLSAVCGTQVITQKLILN